MTSEDHMGMFDWVKYSAPCTHCGALLSGFQSKDGPCGLERLEPWQVQRLYDQCQACGTFNEYRVILDSLPDPQFHLELVTPTPIDR